MGQVLIKKISSWADERGNRAIYGDTDSALVTSNKTDKFEIIEEGID
jgi:DNA polymerase elongation subunit (family B)